MKEIFLEIVDLKKSYDEVNALKGISFSIEKGEVLALLGVNGAGKTTLSSILATLCPPTSGQVIWQGKSIFDNLLAYRRILGFCPQSQNLDLDLNVEENLLFSGRYYGLAKGEINDRKEELLEKFGLKAYAKRELDSLSGGYRQRFMLARTLMHKPSFVILDEPTVGLDPQLRRQVWKLILDMKEEGVTILLTTHYLDEADILSDRVCVIDGGQIQALGTAKGLKNEWKKGNLEEVFLALIEQQVKNG